MFEKNEIVEQKDPTHYSKLDPKTLKVCCNVFFFCLQHNIEGDICNIIFYHVIVMRQQPLMVMFTFT